MAWRGAPDRPELGETLTGPTLLALPGSLRLLSATNPVNFGVEADPITRKLKATAAVIGGFLASRPVE
ncbi:MAG: hypothetical protein RMK20_13355 [Verrucomicrobiales bacterium]|nr:hypothetical protein [Verrucomicrobiales bacterium]